MIFDWHDAWEGQMPWDQLRELKRLRPDFRCTLFGAPGRGSPTFWASIPDWIELAVHGFLHPDPYECQDWTREQTLAVLDSNVVREFFADGWCSPGWQISDGTYQALLERDFWLADQSVNNDRRPSALRVHLLGQPDHYHGHTHNVCGNGIEESWDEVVLLVQEAESFEFVSEAVR